LATVVTLIEVITPLTKTMVYPFVDRDIRAVDILFPFINKFTLLDIFLVALTIFFLKIADIAEVTSQPGLYFLIAFLCLSLAYPLAISKLPPKRTRCVTGLDL